MVVISKALMKAALLITASFSLSGCVYDVGLGFASDGYNDDGYGCDPYGGYDSYYDCDYGQGFGDIGFSGGYFDNYFYPGYGFFLFDNVGRRYPMRDHHRRYWGEKRHGWYRERHGRDRDGKRYKGRQRGYSDDAPLGVIGSPERNGGRIRDGDDDKRESRRGRNDPWRGGKGRGADAVPVPNTEYSSGRRDRRIDQQSKPSPSRHAPRIQQDGLQAAVPTPRATPTPRPERMPEPVRRGRDEGVNIRDQ